MAKYTILNRPIWIRGNPSDWTVATKDSPNAQLVTFDFEISDAGDVIYMLFFCTKDRTYGADFFRTSLEEVLKLAETYGVHRDEWVKTSN